MGMLTQSGICFVFQAGVSGQAHPAYNALTRVGIGPDEQILSLIHKPMSNSIKGEMDHERFEQKLVVGCFNWPVVGSVTALLLAPKSGRELRQDITEGARQVTDKGQELAVKWVSRARKSYPK